MARSVPYSDAEWAVIHAAIAEGFPNGLGRPEVRKVRGQLKAAGGVERSVDAVRQVLYRVVRSETEDDLPLTYQDWLRRQGELLSHRRSAEPDISPAPAEFRGTTEQERLTFQADSRPGVACLAVGDMQFGEHQFLLEAWEDVISQAAQRMQGAQRVRLLLLGDSVTGSGVFRAQEMKVALPAAQPQVLYAAGRIARAVEAIRRGAKVEQVEVVSVQGNHDVSKGGADLAFELVRVLHDLGYEVAYGGLRAAVNLAPEGAEPYLLGLEHSKGNSQYYARSYASLRDLQRYTIQSVVMGRYQDQEGVLIPLRRWCCGHTHWLDIGQDIGGIGVDTVGGWTRPERYNLGGAVRKVGAILYLHTGDALRVETVSPGETLLRRLVDDPHLHTDNLADIAGVLREVTERYIEIGLVAPPGEVL